MNRWIIYGLVPLPGLSCSAPPPETSSHETLDTIEVAEDVVTQTEDQAYYPTQIGNDKGWISVVEKRIWTNGQLTESEFDLVLEDVRDYSATLTLNRDSIANQLRKENSALADTLAGAVITNLYYQGIRSNAHYFMVELEHPTLNKVYSGRFGWFYRTRKKGQLFGLSLIHEGHAVMWRQYTPKRSKDDVEGS